jgi:hypothetical protein
MFVIFSRRSMIVCLLILPALAQAASRTSRPRFDRDIRPILSENCFPCHGADANKRKAKLRLDIREGPAANEVIMPGRPEESDLIKRIFSKDDDERMPPPDSKRHLSDPQKELLRAWVKDGAKYEKHWAFGTPVKPSLPAVKRTKWPRNGIDRFILGRLEEERLSPSAPAPLAKLLRRASLDLTGLPPSLEQIKGWLAQQEPYAAAVNDLLASPRFGERMASDWMDVARYADTHGFNNDSQRTMWRWRDWVIDSFNRNLPYDRFLTEQLAGDLLENPALDQLIATGFNRNHVINSEGGIVDEEYRVEYVVDRLQTTSLAWLGLTTGCARCHDHKFDPVTQKDFYRLYAFFNNNDESGEDGRVGNAAPIIVAPTKAQQTAIAKHRAAVEAAEKNMNSMVKAQAWRDITFEELLADKGTNSLPETNVVVSLHLPAGGAVGGTITNLADGKPVGVEGNVIFTNGPPGETGMVFGDGVLKIAALPRFDAGKGWAFSAWVRRDAPTEGPLFSTMSFSVPASSESYGRGVEIRCTAQGAVEVRLARRWPAYSINVVTRATIPAGEWRHLLMACDGSASARGVRVFLDGQECFRDVLRDNFPDVGVSGTAQIGRSQETNSAFFTGALADIKLLSQPIVPDQQAAFAATAVLRLAYGTPATARSTSQTELLRRAWLERRNQIFARAVAEARENRAAMLSLERDAPSTMITRELPVERPTHVLFRGQYDQPRERVEPGVPEFLLPFPAGAPRNRLGLAQWLTDPRHPLTARVVVNHYWQNLFGAGIVKSAEDFGYQADYPSHPELLDWLAVEFVESGWDVKKLIRLIVTSSTYCQDSKASAALNERDPDNRLLARGPRQRLTAEMLRDQALAVSGLLHEETGGPPVFPYQPTNLYKSVVVAADYPGTTYAESKGTSLYRRSLYTFWKRTVPHPTLAAFDAPDREVCVARRLRTNTPLQALALMNDPIQLEAARKLAERMLMEGGNSPLGRLDFAFQLATARHPESTERKAMSSLLERRLAHYRADPEAAKAFLSVGASEISSKLNAAELAAYANVASLILNLDETITRN